MSYRGSTVRDSLARISLFTLMTFLITIPYDYLMNYLRDLSLIQLYQISLTFRNFIPLTSVLFTLLMLRMGIKSSLRSYGLRKCKIRFLFLSGLTPFLIYFIGSIYALILGFEVVNPLIPLYRSYGMDVPAEGGELTLALSLTSSLFVGSTAMCLIMLGQEVGWRGLLLEEASHIFKKSLLSNLLVGIIWGLWYSPLIILHGMYYPEHRDVVGILAMIAVHTPLSVVFSYLKLRIGSLLAPAAASGVLNVLHNLMAYTVVVDDPLYAMPTGLLGIASISTLATIQYLRQR